MTLSQSKFVVTFLTDAEDLVQQMENIFIELEEYPGNVELINNLFRSIHTLKGSSSFMGFKVLAGLAHAVENILDSVRSNRYEFTEDIINVIFDSFGLIKNLLEDIQKNATDNGRDISSMLGKIAAIESGQNEPSEEMKVSIKTDSALTDDNVVVSRKNQKLLGTGNISCSTLVSLLSDEEIKEINNNNAKGGIFYLKLDFELETSMPVARAMFVIRELDNKTNLLVTVPPIEYLEEEFNGTIDFLFETSLNENEIVDLLELDKIKISELKKIEKLQCRSENLEIMSDSEIKNAVPDDAKAAEVELENSRAELSRNNKFKDELNARREVIRVDIQKLDQLMNLAGELVTNRTRNNDLIRGIRDRFKSNREINDLYESIQEQSRIVSEIQEGIMNSRLVPVGAIFHSVPLVVREISRETGKQVKCTIRGESTELDKKLVDGIREAIMHVVRNAIDHGIELPEERIRLGKPENGQLLLEAYQEYNQIVIKIKDDGRGIEKEKIRRKIQDRKSPGQKNDKALSDHDLMTYIFLPGFSTMEDVTDRSGRGVGMDVVKKEIEKLKGSIQVESEEGKGTAVILRLPITLAIIQGLLVKSEENIYAIPIANVSEIIFVKRHMVNLNDCGEMLFRHNDKVLPIYTLGNLLEIKRDDPGNEFYVVILNYLDKIVGVIVDDLVGEREIVIKNLNGVFLDIGGIAGASIMGDGTVVLIIDIPVLLRKHTVKTQSMDVHRVKASVGSG
ncbi:MAG: chemotaxis protein CheA [Candidatus Krumholzibacteriota bacterium]|nr:chemotaxis protein CheA [Candidatus Krumholzibacteriota bacterium]